MCHQIVSVTYIFAGEAKERTSMMEHIHTMSREAHEKGKELLPVEQKGNATYISLHTSQPMCSTMQRAMVAGTDNNGTCVYF